MPSGEHFTNTKGNKKAFKALYEKYAPLLNGVVKKLIQDPQGQEVMLEQIFIRAWKQGLEKETPAFISLLHILREIYSGQSNGTENTGAFNPIAKVICTDADKKEQKADAGKMMRELLHPYRINKQPDHEPEGVY